MSFYPKQAYPDLYDVVLGLEADMHWILHADNAQEALTGIGFLRDTMDEVVEYVNDARVALLPKPGCVTPDMEPTARNLNAALRRALDAEVAPSAIECLELLTQARTFTAHALARLDIAVEAMTKEIP